MWCGNCYSALSHSEFPIHETAEEVEALWSKGEASTKFKVGVDGAFLVVPFQCDVCWFRNLEGRDYDVCSFCDRRLMCYIRRVNLDLIWSRSPSTIANVRRSLTKLLQSWKEMNLKPVLPTLKPWPLDDSVGFSLALGLLRYSQNQGRNTKNHLQFDSVRKLRTTFSHIHEASSTANLGTVLSFRNQKGDVFTNSSCVTQSRFYTMFMRGLLLRMGRQTKVDLGLDYRILLAIQNILFEKINQAADPFGTARDEILIGSFLVFGFVFALRGNEIFMVEAGALKSGITNGKAGDAQVRSHVVVPLLGRFKNEENSRLHLVVSVSETNSGLQPRTWAEYLVKLNSYDGLIKGPAFSDKEGKVLSSRFMNERFHDLLEQVRDDHPEFFKDDVEIREVYSIYRSLRRGSTARAVDMKVSTSVINLHNRWRSIENRKGQRSSRNMCDYYTDLRLVINARLLFTQSL